MGVDSIEKQLLSNKEKAHFEQEETSVLKDAILAYKQEGPRIEDFSDLQAPGYDDVSRTRDQATVTRLEEKFSKESLQEKEMHFYADILEVILSQFSNAWVPGFLSKTSLYDDFTNKSDLVMEIATDTGIYRLILDVTSSSANAQKKLAQTSSELSQGKFHEIKYFQSEEDDAKGPLQAPRIVIGADRAEIVELGRFFIRYLQATKVKDIEAKRTAIERIEKHRLGAELREEILVQLHKGQDYLRIASTPSIPKIEYLRDIGVLLQKYGKQKAPKVFRGSEKNSILTTIILAAIEVTESTA